MDQETPKPPTSIELTKEEQEELQELFQIPLKKRAFKFENLDTISSRLHPLIALNLIEAGWGYAVANNLDKFQGIDHQEIALKIIEVGWGYAVANNLDKFEGLDHKEIALKIIEAGFGYEVVNNLYKFKDLDHLDHQEIALKSIEAGFGHSVANNLDKFKGIDHQKIALKIIEAGFGNDVAYNLDKFQGLDHQEIALKIIEAGFGTAVVYNLDKFKGLDHQKLDFFPSFIDALESTGGDIKQIIDLLFVCKSIVNERVMHLYVIRMFLLFPDKYHNLVEKFPETGEFDTKIYKYYKKDIEELHSLLKNIGKEKLNTERSSFNLEIEAMNLDPHMYAATGGMELDTPITNDIPELIALVRKLDEIQKNIKTQIKSELKPDEEMVGVYDSVHINIGLPGEFIGETWRKETQANEGISSLLQLIGLIYNIMGRVTYMFRKFFDSLVIVDGEEQTKGGYKAKLQNRLWSFNLAVENAPMLEILLLYMEKIIREYRKNPKQARKSVDALSDKIAKFIKLKQEEFYTDIGEKPRENFPMTYGDLIDDKDGVWRVDSLTLEARKFSDAYLPHRTEILKFIMTELANEIKGT